MKKSSIIGVLILCFAFWGKAQVRNEIHVPDPEGYRTLKCDFHIHTVFSDGLVWPTVRVDEAYREGLDAIALTEHLEYLPIARILLLRTTDPMKLQRKQPGITR